MSEENQVSEAIADETVSEAVETTSTEAEVETKSDDKVAEAPRTFTQEELDAAIGKRLAREHRKWEREQQMAVVVEPKSTEKINPEQFESTEAYADALALRKADEILAQREVQKHQHQAMEAYHDREEEARNKYDDFTQVAYNDKVCITPVMAEAIYSADIGPDIAYFLGSNPKEAERISKLSPAAQAKEIGRIEAKLEASPPQVKKTSKAADPIPPVNGRGAGVASFDTTDPRAAKSMSASDWIEAERERQRRNFARK